MSRQLIRLVNVTKTFGDITALDHINLTIEDGDYLCILGPTEAGKTTLLRIIAGLIKPDEGEIYFEGNIVNEVSPEERDAVYIFQEFALFPHLTVLQNVSFGPAVKNWDKDMAEDLVSEILEMVRLADRQDAFPHELSGGMQQRVALARGIASGAKVLLLDEPFGALDARLKVDLRSQLRKLVKDQKLTAIHVTHDQEEAITISDKIVVLRGGRIEQMGTPLEVYSKPKSVFIANFVGGANFIEGTVEKVDEKGALIRIRGGLHVRVCDRSKRLDEKVVVAVRLEDTSIETLEMDGANNFPATIKSAIFMGGSIEYELSLQNSDVISSKILFSDPSQFHKPDEKVIVSIRPEKCIVFSYPKLGLLKEIEAI